MEVVNTLLIHPAVKNLELAMRFSTDINNGNVFYTDVNGMQVCTVIALSCFLYLIFKFIILRGQVIMRFIVLN